MGRDLMGDQKCADGCGRRAAGYGGTSGLPLCAGAMASEDFPVKGELGGFCGMTREEVRKLAQQQAEASQ